MTPWRRRVEALLMAPPVLSNRLSRRGRDAWDEENAAGGGGGGDGESDLAMLVLSSS